MTGEVGIIGLGAMGRNLALNLLDDGFVVHALSYQSDEVSALMDQITKDQVTADQAASANCQASMTVADFVKGMSTPRRILLMVTAGSAVDQVIADLVPMLSRGDTILDGGNSFFEDTVRRENSLSQSGIQYLGCGISGGADGARYGASVMVGGKAAAYQQCLEIVRAISLVEQGNACFGRVGDSGAGHFVKMVHNGIEYGIMQLIAECYGLMRDGLGWKAPEMAEAFRQFGIGEQSSFLLDITVDILEQQDDLSNDYLLDQVSDKAKQKGTGRWTVDTAMQLGVPIPTIIAAVTERQLSAMQSERRAAAAVSKLPAEELELSLDTFNDALQLASLAAYAQGFELLKHGEWKIDLAQVAGIWRGGCIIRSALLEGIQQAFLQQPQTHLFRSEPFARQIEQLDKGLRTLVSRATEAGISVPAMSASLAYLDSLRTALLPTNLIQGQRDYFGAHTYERNDRPGVFHFEWNKD